MKRASGGFAVLLLGLGLVVQANAAILTNGDAETADLTGWTPDYTGASSGNTNIIASVTQQAQSTGTVQEYGPDYFFTFANEATGSAVGSGDTIFMYQTGTSGLGAPLLRLSGWLQTETYQNVADTATIKLSVLDPTDVEVGSVTTGPLSSQNLTWEPFMLDLKLTGLSGFAKWRVDLSGTVNSTTYTNTFYDDLSLQAIPEPASLIIWSLLAAVGITVGCWRRRRKGT